MKPAFSRVIPLALCLQLSATSACASTLTRSVSSQNATQAPFRISFSIDKDYDKKHIIAMFRHNDPAGLEARARSMGIDVNLAHQIHDATALSEMDAQVQRLVDDRFTKDGPAIEASKEEFETLWENLTGPFSEVVTGVTQSPWIHDNYLCVVSGFHPGLSNWSGNKVAIKFDRPAPIKRRILAHEIALSQVFQLTRKQYPASEISDWQLWAFSEITAVLILDDPRLRGFWPGFARAGEYFTHSNYPQLSDLEKRLKALFDSRESFVDYLESSLPILKTFTQTHGG